jgi:8-amino-7-oxononanoate synthase
MAAGAAIAAIDLVERDPGLVRALHERIRDFRAACAPLRVPLLESATAIQPVVVGDAQRALDVAARLREAGFLVPAIRPPTVPEATSRLRVSICAAHTAGDVQSLAHALGKALAP